MKNSKYVSSYWTQEYKSGVFQLMFNTTEKWINFHRYSDDEYIFGADKYGETTKEWQSRIQTVEEFLPKEINYLPTVFQEKD